MRFAVVKDGELQAALYISRGNGLPSREWLISQLGGDGGASSMELLAGRSAQPAQDRGPILCVCFDVGTRTILKAIADQQLTSVEAVGRALLDGTNCGNCSPGIEAMLHNHQEPLDALGKK